jgi:MFS family permease
MSSPGSSQQARWYFASVGTFMVPQGIQSVLLPYLLAIQLQQPAQRFGLTLMLGQLPMLLLLLVGGWLADRVDARRLLIGLHLAGLIVPLLLALAVWHGQVSELMVLLYAVSWGLIGAFAIPARDGLLKRVAAGNVQRMVTMATGVQFGTQMIGQLLAGSAQQLGSISILLLQCLVLAVGVYVATRLPAAAQSPLPIVSVERGSFGHELAGGLRVLWADPSLRATFAIIIGMGVFFTGVFLVLIPIALRDIYQGSAADIAFGFVVFGVGLLVSIVAIMRRGGVRRPGRAMALSMFSGSLALLPMLLAPPLWAFYVCIFVWGMSGGVGMTMSRSIMQELAPASHQSRVMAAFSLATTGGAPVGSLLMGYVIGLVGARWAVVVPIIGVASTTIAVLATHSIWRLQSRSNEPTVPANSAR